MSVSARFSPSIVVWLRRLGEFAATQGVIQIIGMVAGVLIARWLPVESYAKYALATAFITAITVVGDSGIGSQVIAIGGRYSPVQERLPALMRQAHRVRLVISGAISAVAAPALFIMLLRIGAGWAESLMLSVLVIATVYISLQASLYRSAMQLLFEFRAVQTSGVVSSSARIVGALAVAPWPQLGAVVPTAANAIAMGIQAQWLNAVLRRLTGSAVTALSAEDKSEMTAAAKRLVPLNLVLVAQNQGTGMVLGALGATVALAEVTAVSRYGIALTLIPTVVISVLGPVFARTPANSGLVVKRLLGFILASAAAVALATAVLALAWEPLLALLGSNYESLRLEYWIVTAGTAVASVATVLSGLNLNRGWTAGSWIMAPSAVLWLAGGSLALDVTSTLGASVFMALSSLPVVVTAGFQTLLGLRNLKANAAPAPGSP